MLVLLMVCKQIQVRAGGIQAVIAHTEIRIGSKTRVFRKQVVIINRKTKEIAEY